MADLENEFVGVLSRLLSYMRSQVSSLGPYKVAQAIGVSPMTLYRFQKGHVPELRIILSVARFLDQRLKRSSESDCYPTIMPVVVDQLCNEWEPPKVERDSSLPVAPWEE